jgi:hypothetical protein
MAIKHHGRKGEFGTSAAEAAQAALAIVPGTGRPPPPDDLTKEEAALWTMYVNAMSPNYFTPETRPVLAELCKAVVNSGRVHEEIKRVRDSEFTDMDELAQVLKLAAAATKAVDSLSDRLRLTKKSRFTDHQAAAEQARASYSRPWEEGRPS